jgi:cytochrome oxidase assembly protein ShyY1
VYRFLLTPRWLGLTLLVVLAVPLCLWLGGWQLGRFQARIHDSHVAQQAAEARGTATPLSGLLAGADGAGVTSNDVGRSVTLTGSYDTAPAHQYLVPDRTVNGRTGFYVLTPFRLAGGSAVAVVRGWAPGTASSAAAARLAPVPGGTVSLTGRMQAAEDSSTPGVIGGGLPSGQLGMISPATLINLLPYQVWNGWVALDSGPGTGQGLTPVPTYQPSGGGGLTLRAMQNLGYTLQWFVFAGFAVYMWCRFVRREAEERRDRELGLGPEQESLEPEPSA